MALSIYHYIRAYIRIYNSGSIAWHAMPDSIGSLGPALIIHRAGGWVIVLSANSILALHIAFTLSLSLAYIGLTPTLCKAASAIGQRFSSDICQYIYPRVSISHVCIRLYMCSAGPALCLPKKEEEEWCKRREFADGVCYIGAERGPCKLKLVWARFIASHLILYARSGLYTFSKSYLILAYNMLVRAFID